MAKNAYNATNTRMHYDTGKSDADIHLEMYKGDVDTAFQYNAIFRALSAQRSTEGNSNNFRLDRLGTGTVKARKSGDTLEPTKIANDKVNILVGVSLYTQNTFDYMDTWTSPDRTAEIARNNGTKFAKLFDEAHIIQLIKASAKTAPTHLQGAFFDGIRGTVNLKANPASLAELEANAVALEAQHKAAVEVLITRDVPLQNMVTLVSPAVFSALTYHPRLLDKSFSDNNGDFGGRRVLRLNGLPIVENTCFPKETSAHPLTDVNTGADFNVSADEAKYEMLVFDKMDSLVTVTAKELHASTDDVDYLQTSFLTTVAMYTVGVRRFDKVAAIKVERA